MKPHVARKLQQYLLDQYYENGTIARLSTQDTRRVLVYLQRTEARRRRSVRWLRRLNSMQAERVVSASEVVTMQLHAALGAS